MGNNEGREELEDMEFEGFKEEGDTVTNTRMKQSYYASVGKRVVFPAWVWHYVSAKAFFYHMTRSAYLLMLVQREMEQNNAEIKRYMEAGFFEKVKQEYKSGLPEVVNPFDGSFLKMVMDVKQAHELREMMVDTPKDSYWVENPEARRIELKIAYNDEAFCKKMGIISMLSERGWKYSPYHRCWFSPIRGANKKGIKSEDVALVTGIIDAINKRGSFKL